MSPASWRKSSKSGGNGGNCVEVRAAGTIDVQDSKNPGPKLTLAPEDWRAFTVSIKAGRIDLA
jgi:hypothetical protein